MQTFKITVHMNGRTYDEAGVATDIRDCDEYSGMSAEQATATVLGWMTGPDADNVTIAIVAE